MAQQWLPAMSFRKSKLFDLASRAWQEVVPAHLFNLNFPLYPLPLLMCALAPTTWWGFTIPVMLVLTKSCHLTEQLLRVILWVKHLVSLQFIHSFIHSCIQQILNIYYVPCNEEWTLKIRQMVTNYDKQCEESRGGDREQRSGARISGGGGGRVSLSWTKKDKKDLMLQRARKREFKAEGTSTCKGPEVGKNLLHKQRGRIKQPMKRYMTEEGEAGVSLFKAW